MADDTEGTAFAFRESRIQLNVDLRNYRLAAVQKTAYRMADKCTAVLGSDVDGHLPVTLTFDATVTEAAAKTTAQQFFRELLDQELREQIGGETAALRALILAHAFARTDLIERE